MLELEQDSDCQIWKNFGPGMKNFGPGLEPENVTPAISAVQ